MVTQEQRKMVVDQLNDEITKAVNQWLLHGASCAYNAQPVDDWPLNMVVLDLVLHPENVHQLTQEGRIELAMEQAEKRRILNMAGNFGTVEKVGDANGKGYKLTG